MRTFLALASILTAACLCAGEQILTGQSTAAARVGKFTIGKETTVVTGPLNEDGTINYIPALNALTGGEVKNEENAAIPLMTLCLREGNKLAPLEFVALHVPFPGKEGLRITYFSDYARTRNTGTKVPPSVDEQMKQEEMLDQLMKHPWKSVDHPDVAEWLQSTEPAMKELEIACRRPQFFIPFVETKRPATATEGMPFVGLFEPRNALASRAMMRAGQQDIGGALDDLRRIRILARFCEQEHEGIWHLMGIAAEVAAIKGYAGLAASGQLDQGQLELVRKEIEAFSPIPSEDPVRRQVEEMMALDEIMICIGGNSEFLMQLLSLDFSRSKHIDLGDLPHADWDVAMKEVQRIYAPDNNAGDETFSRKLEELTEKAKTEGNSGVPQTLDSLLGADAEQLQGRIEKFLKILPGESREAYTRRVTSWMVGGRATDLRRALLIEWRASMLRDMSLLSVGLAEYRLASGSYPDSLQRLGKPVLQDAFSGGDIHYRTHDGGFTLWSDGNNQKDDDTKGDDIVLGTTD